ncbi:MAG TPA: hypothetical protein PLD10_18555 [Rhodopila sp.]|nr:hypothetical protein [Rhodopila sp.]
MLTTGCVFVDLPTVEGAEILITALADSRIAAAPVEPPSTVDVRSLRERPGPARE